MAQVWVSVSELAELCGCSVQYGLAHARRGRWDQAIGRDGVTRVLLPSDLAFDFMRSQGSGDVDLNHVADTNVRALKSLASDGSTPRQDALPNRMASTR